MKRRKKKSSKHHQKEEEMSAKVLLKLCMPCTGMDIRESDGMLAISTSSLSGELWDGEVSILDIYTGAEKTVLSCPCGVSSSRWHTSTTLADRVLGGGDDGRLYIWDSSDTDPNKEIVSPETAEETEVSRHTPLAALAGHDDSATSIAVHKATGDVVSGSWDSTVRLWDIDSQHSANVFAAPVCTPSCVLPRINDVQWSPTDVNVFAAVTSDGALHLWDKRGLGAVRTAKVSDFAVMCVAWSSDGISLALGDEDGWISVLDARNLTENGRKRGRPLFRRKLHAMGVSALAYSPNLGPVLASGGEDNRVCVTDVASSESKYVSFGTIEDIGVTEEGDEVPGHVGFVGGLCWVRDSLSTLLSAGWDYRVLNHTIGNLD